MRSDYTHIVVVLDSSGSMASIRQDTIGGFNTFLDAQKKAEGKATLTQIQFSSPVHKSDGIKRRRKVIKTNFPIWQQNPFVAGGIGGGNAIAPVYGSGLAQANLDLKEEVTYEEFIDTTYVVVDDFKDIQEVKPLTKDTFVPGGGTPLLDSIGTAIEQTGVKLASLPESDRPSKVLFVIITDGEENQSQEFDYATIEKMIKHQTDIYSWDFMYIGANQDAIKEGSKMGIAAGSSLNYAATAQGVDATYNMVASKTAVYRSAVSKSEALASISYNDEERTIAMGQANTSAQI